MKGKLHKSLKVVYYACSQLSIELSSNTCETGSFFNKMNLIILYVRDILHIFSSLLDLRVEFFIIIISF